jgi:hypothetical protein
MSRTDERYQQIASRSWILDLRSSSQASDVVIPGSIGNPVAIVARDAAYLSSKLYHLRSTPGAKQ